MFGYVAPHKCELKVKELTQYQAWYCGLCHTIHAEYGQMPRLALDYDCVFLALLLEGVTGAAGTCDQRKCVLKPFRKKAPVARPSEALRYAAGCNVLLYWYKLRDDWQDEKSLKGFTGHHLLRRAAMRAQKQNPELARCIEAGISGLSRLESAREGDIDSVADYFAGILRGISTGFQPLGTRDREILSWLGYHLGRWIYLMDAWEDRVKDEKSGAYNPLLIAGADEERASFLLYASLGEMEKAYDLLDIKAHKGLLDNIMYQGCRLRTRLLLEGDAG